MARELTAEILLGAGFKKTVVNSFELEEHGGIVKVYFNEEKPCYKYSTLNISVSMYLTTVKKLQQALRLCELDDLADKFDD